MREGGFVWKDATGREKQDFEEIGRGKEGWRRIETSKFPGLVGGYRDVSDYAVAIIEGSTRHTGTRSDCTVVTFVGNRPDMKAGAVDQDVWVTAIHSTGMNTKVAEFQHPDYEGRTRFPGSAFWDTPNQDVRSLDSLPLVRDHGPLSEIEGTVYEAVLKDVRRAATSASTVW